MNLNRKTEVYQTQKNLELLKLCELDNLKEASIKHSQNKKNANKFGIFEQN